MPLMMPAAVTNFYPRPPHGGRPVPMVRYRFRPYFYPRPPHGGRRLCPWSGIVFAHISIHALLTEGDTRAAARAEAKAISIHAQLKKRQTIREFLSTPSSRRATT